MPNNIQNHQSPHRWQKNYPYSGPPQHAGQSQNNRGRNNTYENQNHMNRHHYMNQNQQMNPNNHMNHNQQMNPNRYPQHYRHNNMNLHYQDNTQWGGGRYLHQNQYEPYRAYQSGYGFWGPGMPVMKRF